MLLGSADTPIFVGSLTFDVRQLSVTNVSVATDFFIRLIWTTGAQTPAQAVTAGQYTEKNFARPGAAGAATLVDFMLSDIPVGTSLWAECNCATNGGTVSFYLQVHEHPSPFD